MQNGVIGLCLFLVALSLAACNVDDKKTETGLPGNLFFEYRIWGEEGNSNITCMIQFRTGGPNGPAVLLSEPARVALDNEVLNSDSAALSGAFYEIVKPINEFRGKHAIVFTGKDNKKQSQEFEFITFSLASELPEQVKKKPFTIRLVNFGDNENKFRLSLTDTAFMTNDVNEMIHIEDGELAITQAMLDRLQTGPVAIEIFMEQEKRIRNGLNEKGRIWVSYGLRRQIELVD